GPLALRLHPPGSFAAPAATTARFAVEASPRSHFPPRLLAELVERIRTHERGWDWTVPARPPPDAPTPPEPTANSPSRAPAPRPLDRCPTMLEAALARMGYSARVPPTTAAFFVLSTWLISAALAVCFLRRRTK